MGKFKKFLVEGVSGKYKVGNEPTFKNKDHQYIANQIYKFVQKNKHSLRDIHYPKDVKNADYNSKNTFTLPVTDEKTILDMCAFLGGTMRGKDFTYTYKSATFLVRLSSGRGFFYEDEKSQTTPSTDQQETGTIKFLEFYQKNGQYPTQQEINDLVKFNFDNVYYNSFKYQTDAILEFTKGINGYSIDLDSNSNSIRYKIFNDMVKIHGIDLKDKDNWNPADIWLYKNKSTIIKKIKSCTNQVEYNQMIKELFITRDLIGVSLKKAMKALNPKIIDQSDHKEFRLSFDKCEYNLSNTYFDIKSKGHPEGFMIRARAKAKTISKVGDIKIYFEGKEANSTEFLGAIEKRKFLALLPNGDTAPEVVTKEDIINLAKEVQSYGYMTVTNLKTLDGVEMIKLQYVYVMLRYAKAIYQAGEENLNDLGMAGYKMNNFSSIHLKIGGK